jgi:hypothetical protein
MHAIEILRKSKLFSHIGMCVQCLEKLTLKEMQKNQADYELVYQMRNYVKTGYGSYG